MNTNTAKFLFEGISADVVRYLVERNDMDLQEAISTDVGTEKRKAGAITIGHYLSSGHFILQSILQFPVKADW